MALAADLDEAEPGLLQRVRAEAAGQRLVLWAPVLITLGVWAYFALPREPGLITVALFAAVCLGLAGFAIKSGNRLAIAAALVIAGLVLAKARAEWAGTTLLAATSGKTRIEGVVERIETRGARRAVIKLKTGAPRYLRLSYTGKTRPSPGDVIEAEAYLAPLPVPVTPGGFDYGRTLYFEGVGGTGRIAGDATILDRPVPTGYRLRRAIHTVRMAIGGRVVAALPKDLAGFGEALITGERGRIPAAVNQSLQASGLAHVLSISGLHMSLIAGGVFWIVRAILAAFPLIAQRRPVKKWAAVAALATGLGYMTLAGADVATQRSYIMIAVMFFAVLIDRPALSVRNLAIAAIVILATQPESAVAAGFQMSFMAVAGLVAFYESYARWREARFEIKERPAWRRVVEKGNGAVFAMAATTLIAGALSSIPAVHHFGRLAPLSLLGNLLALPIVSLWVMPAALLSVIAMPLGLEGGPLWLLGKGLALVMWISDWVAALPGAQISIAQPALLHTFGLAAAALWLCLWRGRYRIAGLGFLALLLAPPARPPDLLIAAKAENAAVRLDDGRLAPALARKGKFTVERWLRADGDAAKPADAARRGGWTCVENVCRAQAAGRRIVYLQDGASAAAHCRDADILIAAFPLRGACRSVPLRVDRFDVWRGGAYAITFGNGLTVRTSRGEQGARPWVVKPAARKKEANPPP